MDSSWSLGDADLLQQIGNLMWIHQNDTQLIEKVTAARVAYEMYQRMSGERELEALRNQTIMAIAKYIKDNPNASKDQLTKEIAKQIQSFSKKVDEL